MAAAGWKQKLEELAERLREWLREVEGALQPAPAPVPVPTKDRRRR